MYFKLEAEWTPGSSKLPHNSVYYFHFELRLFYKIYPQDTRG